MPLLSGLYGLVVLVVCSVFTAVGYLLGVYKSQQRIHQLEKHLLRVNTNADGNTLKSATDDAKRKVIGKIKSLRD